MFKSLYIEHREKVKFFLFLLIIIVGVSIVMFSDASKLANPSYLKNYLKEREVEGAILFLFFFLIRPFLPIPFMIMGISAGFAFGKLGGFLLSLTGAIIGMSVEFIISKRWGADFIKRKMGKRMDEIMEIVKRGNVLVIALLRLVPIISHFDTMNYLLGITKLKFTTFIKGSTLGILPWVILFTLFGDSVRESNNLMIAINLIMMVFIGLVALIGYRKIKSENIKEER